MIIYNYRRKEREDKTKIINYAEVKIQTERKIGYNLVMKDLETLKDTFTDDTELVSLETGECITMSEKSRVLGILSGHKQNQIRGVNTALSKN